jgi:hypothetical protein
MFKLISFKGTSPQASKVQSHKLQRQDSQASKDKVHKLQRIKPTNPQASTDPAHSNKLQGFKAQVQNPPSGGP